jgi:formate hydrogenlyase transcriptional activator
MANCFSILIPDEQLAFESLLADLSAGFVGLPAGQVDSNIQDAQRRICECLGIEHSSLWQSSDSEPGILLLTHLYREATLPPPPDRMDGDACFPWAERKLRNREIVCFSSNAGASYEAATDRKTWQAFGIKSTLAFPLCVGDGPVFGALSFDATTQEREWPEVLVKRLQLLAQVFANALARQRSDISEAARYQEKLQKSYEEILQLKEKLQAESDYLQEEIKDIGKYEEIVGQSEALKEVLTKVEQVAHTNSIVLITGESGTGKELIARAIHARSKCKDRAMVKVDCASLPSSLIESELFGREKGAYTGALTRQIGRIETADGSTLFLDEMGELGVDVQAKLLRVVQDGEFERLGSAKTIHVNVRIIAATHRDLAERVKNGTFREDLFYRLNVFPIRVPPLRERPEDIPMLVTALLREFEKKMGKKIRGVSSRMMDELKLYPWPGNIRELRNVIERAVIITTGERLNLQLPKASNAPGMRTLKEAEIQHILSTLEKTRWRIKGPVGAAMMLGMKPSTLYTKMRLFHIPTRHEKSGMPA